MNIEYPTDPTQWKDWDYIDERKRQALIDAELESRPYTLRALELKRQMEELEKDIRANHIWSLVAPTADVADVLQNSFPMIDVWLPSALDC